MNIAKKGLLVVAGILLASGGVHASDKPSYTRSMYNKYIQRAKRFDTSTEVDVRRVALKGIESEYKPEGFFGWARRMWSKSLYDMPINDAYTLKDNVYTSRGTVGDLLKKRLLAVLYDYKSMKPSDWISVKDPLIDRKIEEVILQEEQDILNKGLKKIDESNKLFKKAIVQNIDNLADLEEQLIECKKRSRKMGYCDREERAVYQLDDTLRFDRNGYFRSIEDNEKTKNVLLRRRQQLEQRKMKNLDQNWSKVWADYEQRAAEQGQ